MDEDTKKFIFKIGKLLQNKTDENRSTNFLTQQISTEIQRGNADEPDKISSIFDLL